MNNIRLLLLVTIITISGLFCYGQGKIRTGSKLLDSKLKELKLFNQRYNYSHIFSIDSFSCSENNINLKKISKKGLETIAMNGKSDYFVFGVDKPSTCRYSRPFTIIDDVYGTGKEFIIVIDSHVPVINDVYRKIKFAEITYADKTGNTFILKIGKNADIPILFLREYFIPASQTEYRYIYEQKNIKKLSQLIELLKK